MTIDGLDEETRRKIYGILKILFPNAQIYLFGSRAWGKFRQFSDIDLAIADRPEGPSLQLGEARDVLEALNIPYKVDLVDLYRINATLRDKIVHEGVLWNG